MPSPRIPNDIAELLRRLATGWKSTNESYVTETARSLCSVYGIQLGASAPVGDDMSLLDRNTAALVEWFNLISDTSQPIEKVSDSKVLTALLGNLSEERAQEHFSLLVKARANELPWYWLISIIRRAKVDSETEYSPKEKTLRYLNEQLQQAQDVTYALARQAIAEDLGL